MIVAGQTGKGKTAPFPGKTLETAQRIER